MSIRGSKKEEAEHDRFIVIYVERMCHMSRKHGDVVRINEHSGTRNNSSKDRCGPKAAFLTNSGSRNQKTCKINTISEPSPSRDLVI